MHVCRKANFRGTLGYIWRSFDCFSPQWFIVALQEERAELLACSTETQQILGMQVAKDLSKHHSQNSLLALHEAVLTDLELYLYRQFR